MRDEEERMRDGGRGEFGSRNSRKSRKPRKQSIAVSRLDNPVPARSAGQTVKLAYGIVNPLRHGNCAMDLLILRFEPCDQYGRVWTA